MEGHMTPRHWLALTGLTFAAFIFNTSEFVPIGLLTDIKEDFHLTEASVGLLISVYAWVVTLLSLPLMIMVSRMELRRLMLWLIGLFAICQVVSYLSTSYPMLMASRIGVACTHAIFWSVVAPMAVRITPANHKALALSMVVTGSSVAMVLGMPLGRMIGLHLGWRMTFLSIGGFAFLTLAYTHVFLPAVPNRGGFSPRRLPTLLSQGTLRGLYLFTLLVATAYYVCYSYVEPFLKQVTQMPDSLVTATLMLMGGAGFLGSLIYAKCYDRNPRLFVACTVGVLTTTLAATLPAAFSPCAIALTFALMGMAATAYNVAMQSVIIQVTSEESTAVAMSIFSGIFNLGIGCGAFLGGSICTHDTIAHIGLGGGAIALIALLYWTLRLGRMVH
ncbi:MAG TPA: sugar transporter [Prevotellaceae bacterium]|nr:sugar transporter [Prevotellaceae bacterium]